jgi:hypothetical protein
MVFVVLKYLLKNTTGKEEEFLAIFLRRAGYGLKFD